MMAKLIVIIGITGTQGASVAATYLKEPGWKIRGITRDPTKPSAQALQSQSVEIVQCDLSDASSLLSAFSGATAIFAVIDFWAGFADPSNQAKAREAGRTVNEHAYDIEVRHGMNIAEAAAAPATMRTLERFVYSSLSDAQKWSGGKMLTLQMGEYMTNWKTFVDLGPQKQGDGSYLLVKPCHGDAPIPMVVAAKDTGSFVRALIHSPPGTNLLGYGSLISWAGYMRSWSSILHVDGKFQQIPLDQYMKEAPALLAKELREAYAYQGEFGWDGGDPSVVHPKDLAVDVPTTSVEDYIKGEDWSALLQHKSADEENT